MTHAVDLHGLENEWKNVRIDQDFQLTMRSHFIQERKSAAATQERFVDLARDGALPSLVGERMHISLKDLQRVEQGKLHQISLDRFRHLCRCIGTTPESLISSFELDRREGRKPNGGAATSSTRGAPARRSISQFGESFQLSMSNFGRPRTVYSLPNNSGDSLRFVNWHTFGEGVELLVYQIKNSGSHIHVDACIGINDAGMVIATFINYAALKRTRLGYLRCGMYREKLVIDQAASSLPELSARPVLMLCDFEVKHASVLSEIVRFLRKKYKDPAIYFSVFGAMTEKENLCISSVEDLVSHSFLKKLNLRGMYIACTMNPPGIEPPLDLK